MKSTQVISAFFLSFSLLYASSAEAAMPFVARVTADHVNVRAGANTNFEVLTQLNNEDQVVVVDERFDWYRIQLPEAASAYVYAEYVLLQHETRGVVVGHRLNVRARPALSSSVIAKVSEGDVLMVRGYEDEWLHIQPPVDTSAWVAKEFLVHQSDDVASLKPKQDVQQIIPFADMRAIQEDTESAESQTPVNRLGQGDDSELQRFTGTLQKLKKSTHEKIQYQLNVSRQKQYLISGYHRMLKAYDGQRVSIKGILLDAESDAPVIELFSIRLKL